jgi:hypothetical protein
MASTLLFQFGAAEHHLAAGSASTALDVAWADLPKAAMVLILQRLGDAASAAGCARVCSSWADAVAGGTAGIYQKECKNMASLDLWLQRHGTNLKSLRIETAFAMPAALPCPHLVDLQLPFVSQRQQT